MKAAARIKWGPPPFAPGTRIKGARGRKVWRVVRCRKRTRTDYWPYTRGWNVVIQGHYGERLVIHAEVLELFGWRPVRGRG